MLTATLGYYIGWWLPWPLLGLHAPNQIAEGVHLAATMMLEDRDDDRIEGNHS